jgi:DNA-binding transcriptional MerR regulator
MPPAARTLSATEFSEITGVSRERLRTWERRHGFPEPVRVGRGARRYRIDDVARVVAVRRSVDHGVPLRAAVDAAREQSPAGISDGARASLAEHAPIAIVVLSGPEPLRVEEVNALVRSRPGAPAPGDELLALAPWYADHPGLATLRNLFASTSVAAACEHPDWTAGMVGTASAIAYRLPQEAGTAPLVALIGIDTARERRTRRELVEAQDERSTLRTAIEQQERWARAKVAVVTAARERGGMTAVTESTEALVRHAGVLDAALVPYMTGALVLGRSARGRIGPATVTVSAYEELTVAMRDSTSTWLSHAACTAVGAPDGLAVHLVPVVAAGESLGALMLLVDEQEHLDSMPGDLLTTVATMLGYVLVRERVVDELRS